MSVDSFKPEVWNAGVLNTLEKSLVFGSCANRNYEGDISEFGDTVHITDLDDVTIVDYTPNTDLADAEVLDTNDDVLKVDQAKAFHFYVDNVDARQVRNDGALMNAAGNSAAYGLRDKADLFLASRMRLGAGQSLGLIDASSTVTAVYDNVIVAASVALDEADVPEENRWLVVPPSVYGKLQLDDRFVKAAYSGSGALHTGVVGDAGGFLIRKSNNGGTTSRSGLSATTASSAKTLTGTAGTFSQADVGLAVTGTGIAASSKIVSVNTDGSVATMDKNATAAGSVSDIAIAGGPVVYAGSSAATTFANQILKTAAYSPEKRFGDAVKGLHVYGGKVIESRKQALVVASVKTA